MSKLTKNTELKEQQDMLDTMDNKKSFEVKEIENTPFTIIKDDNKYFGVIANNKITEDYTTEKECLEELLKVDWNRITQVIVTIVEKLTNKN
jgi:hypothetical protein